MNPGERVSGASVPVRNPRNLDPVYANNFATSTTDWDLTIHFAELTTWDGANGPEPRHELKAAITIPYPIVSILIQQLSEQLARLQQQHALMQAGQRGPLN